jgi:DUF1009 family protein
MWLKRKSNSADLQAVKVESPVPGAVSIATDSSGTDLAKAESLAGQRVGLVAGWGEFPLELARKCLQSGARLYVLGIKGHADARLADLADVFQWVGVAKLGCQIRFFKRHQVGRVALAGKLFKHKLLLSGWGWPGLVPDWTALRVMAPIFISRTRDARDDTILSSVVSAYQRQGIQIVTLGDVAPGLLAPEGLLAGRSLSSSQWTDVCFGWQMARQMGALDIGQSVTVKDQMVLGVEAIEGTDALIERTGKLSPRGFALVKVAKPDQDMRFDVPTVGPLTIQQLAQAGGKVLAIEAGMTILLHRELTLATAKRLGVTVVSVTDQQVAAYRLRGKTVAA